MDFATLKARIAAIIGRAPADVCYELVTADVNQELRLRVMESTATLTEAATCALPSDFLDMVSLYRDTDPRHTLKPLPPQAMQRTYHGSGVPQFYSITDGAMALSPAPNGAESLVMRYLAAVPDLSADGDTNDVLTKYPSIYVYGVLSHHALLIRDMEALAGWAAAYEKAKAQARKDDASYRSGVGSPVPVVRGVA